MSDTPQIAPVDDYPERTYEEAVSETVVPVGEHVDQIKDYHEKNPTLRQNAGHTFPPPTLQDFPLLTDPGAVVVESNKPDDVVVNDPDGDPRDDIDPVTAPAFPNAATPVDEPDVEQEAPADGTDSNVSER